MTAEIGAQRSVQRLAAGSVRPVKPTGAIGLTDAFCFLAEWFETGGSTELEYLNK